MGDGELQKRNDEDPLNNKGTPGMGEKTDEDKLKAQDIEQKKKADELKNKPLGPEEDLRKQAEE